MTKEQLQDIFKKSYDTTTWRQVLQEVFGVKDLYVEPKTLVGESNENVEGHQLGWIEDENKYRIGLFEYEIKAKHNIKLNRVGLRGLVKDFTKFKYDAVLTVFYSKDGLWRLSFICDLQNEATQPKRYSYVFGDDTETYRTPSSRLFALIGTKPTFDTIKDAFSVEALNKEFITEYEKQYSKFFKETKLDTKDNRDYVKKMLGRLVFIQFLQKKGWMGVPADSAEWKGGDPNYLQNLIKRYKGTDQANSLLSDVLEPLFFDTLNNPRTNDIAAEILGTNIRIPYLNGGLFERDCLDKEQIDFTYDRFEELMKFFSSYNFTIDENDPFDAEIGVDPEMLGNIFENLLEDNKDKGAFYTPKEIVKYMCQQSLIEYLKSHTEEGLHKEIEDLITLGVVSTSIQTRRDVACTIDQLLQNVKICDPAIGSGAFPMGVLSEIFHCRQRIFSFTGSGDFLSSEVKRKIIQNSIYGVDIEKGAVDIARLRFWLSLVVDEEEPTPLPNLDYKIVCGNSLVSVFKGQYIELDRTKGMNSVKIAKKKTELYALQREFYSLNGAEKHRKEVDIKRCLLEIIELEIDYKLGSNAESQNSQLDIFEAPKKRGKVIPSNLSVQRRELEELKIKLLSNNPYDELAMIDIPFFDWNIIFSDIFLIDDTAKESGFDIVIGNPPYLRVQGIRDNDPLMADVYTAKYTSATGSFDLYALFVEKGMEIANHKGIVNYIMPSKWTNAAFGKGLRSVVTQNNSAYKIINFGAYQVFNASTYTALQWFKRDSDFLQYFELNRNLTTNQKLGEYLYDLKLDDGSELSSTNLTSQAWITTVGETTKILDRLSKQPRRISDIFEKIFQGLATSKDDVYFLYDCVEVDGIVTGKSKGLDCRVEIEKGFVKPLLKGDDVHRYDTIKTDKVVIFPYKLENGKAQLYTEDEIAILFPKGYTYLKECEDILRDREKGRFDIDGEWFQYGRKQGMLLAGCEKLVAPDISMGGNFAYDFAGDFFQTATVYGYIKKEDVKESYKCLMAILNSKLCWWFLKNTGTTLANGFFRFKPDYINPFPVPAYENIEPAEKIVEQLVDWLVYLKDDSNDEIYGHTPNSRLVVHIEDILNMVIYEIYFREHMKENEIDVVKGLARYSFVKEGIRDEIEKFYEWYQGDQNSIRDKIALVSIRSTNLISYINNNSIYNEQDKKDSTK